MSWKLAISLCFLLLLQGEAAPLACEKKILDFNHLPVGTYVREDYLETYGVTITAIAPDGYTPAPSVTGILEHNPDGGAARIMDSAEPVDDGCDGTTGLTGSSDLATPGQGCNNGLYMGYLLIAQTADDSFLNSGTCATATENAVIEFEFSEPARIVNAIFVHTGGQGGSPIEAKYYDEEDVEVASESIAAPECSYSDPSVSVINWDGGSSDPSFIKKASFNMAGGIAQLVFEFCDLLPTNQPTEVPPTTAPTRSPAPTVYTPIHSCPGPDENPLVVSSGNDNIFDHSNLVRLALSGENSVCMLLEVSDISDELLSGGYESISDADLKPMGRSFNGSAWQAYSGEFNSLAFDCSEGTICHVSLSSPSKGKLYILKSYDSAQSAEQKAMEYLDMVSFGPTSEDFAAFDGDQESWTRAQMDLPLSSHRQFFRERSTDWQPRTSSQGLVHTLNPCDLEARYRNFAIQPKERFRYFTITSIAGDPTKKLLNVMNPTTSEYETRTVVDFPEYGIYTYYNPAHSETLPLPDGTYRFYTVDQPVGGTFRIYPHDALLNPNRAYYLYFGGVPGNPRVQFTDANPPDNALIEIPVGRSDVILEKWFNGTSVRQLTSALSDSNCPADITGSAERTIVARLEGTDEYWIHTMTYLLQENTIESPLSDGGKFAVDGFGATCSNVPRTFLNEDNCVLSDDACYIGDSSPGSVLVCGSPYEVANVFDANNGPFDYGGFDYRSPVANTNRYSQLEEQRESIWLEIALHGQDQLRQRVAWALYQILVVAADLIADLYQTESFVTYYDIFVRHAFGNYFDILKEVTYSPLMGEMLTYINGKSTGYAYNSDGTVLAADENYSRELMQLFTIGVHKLNNDGTLIKDGDGNLVRSYTNEDISEYAKVYTGFAYQSDRANIEDFRSSNQVDPMKIVVAYKDWFPKLGLDSQYVGDGYPLCSDIPSQHFLMAGAEYQLLGSDSTPVLLNTPSGSNWVWVTPTLDETSELAAVLCGGNVNSCTPSTKVVLQADLTCVGIECSIDEPRTIEVASGIWYEYIRPACVNQVYYSDAKTTYRPTSGYVMCANPLNRDAGTTCCSAGSSTGLRNEVFSMERVTFSVAEERCLLQYGNGLCDSNAGVSQCNRPRGCDTAGTSYWSSAPCELNVKINAAGAIAVVHNPQALDEVNNPYDTSKTYKYISSDTKNFFEVDWLESDIDEFVSDYEGSCSSIDGCYIDDLDDLCQCTVVVSETAAYADVSEIASVEEALSKITIAAFDPPSEWQEVAPGISKPSGEVLSATSVLRLTDSNGRVHYRKNIVSKVQIGAAESLEFRNPVSFFSLLDPTLRDARYEVDATLEHFFYHQNMAPFLAIRLAQKFGNSNPSPEYVDTIATAFRTGKYASKFGSGEYGCMEATMAAVIHGDSSSEFEPTHGRLLEPYMKVIKLMRSMGFQTEEFLPRMKADLQQLIGQEAHRLPHVFSFFKPEYQPAGRVASAGLVSPESEILNGPTSINLMNMMISYLKYGANDCYGGFGYESVSSSNCVLGSTPNSGISTYIPVGYGTSEFGEMIDDLALYLTNGRLSAENKAVIEEACATSAASGASDQEIMINAMQLIVASPEYHASGVVRKTGEARPETSDNPAPSGESYKAVVYYMLQGGMDSWNVLVPDTSCGTLNAQYEEARGVLAFDDSNGEYDLKIDATGSGQPCNTFAIHEELTALHEMYNDGDLVFFANTGVVDQGGMTKLNYNSKTQSQIFSHSGMQEEIQRVDPFDEYVTTGVLGRAKDVLSAKGHVVNTIAIDAQSIVLEGLDGSYTITVQQEGFSTFGDRPDAELSFDLEGYVRRLNSEGNMFNNIFAETWSEQLIRALNQVDELNAELQGVSLDSSAWPDNTYSREAWQTIFKLMETHNSTRNTDRDIFFTALGGWDHHSSMKSRLTTSLARVNSNLKMFSDQLKARGLWDNVAVVVTSDFGRTITPNSDGSDHGWAGHYFMMGGAVKGGKIVGAYPSDLSMDSPVRIDERGRMIPTTSWDAIWHGVVQWLGVEDEADLKYCLPNAANTVNPVEGLSGNFPLYNSDDLFV